MKNIFERMGLSEKESQALLELVRLGSCPVSRWAKQVKINRTSMYVLLERLKNEGLVTTFPHQGVMHVRAVPMTELPGLISDRQNELEETREMLVKSLPELQKLEKTYGLTPKVTFYEGKSRVETMYEHVMTEKSFKAFFHPGRLKELMPEYFHQIPMALRKNGGKARELLVGCPAAEEYMRLYESVNHKMALLPTGYEFSSDTIITDEKIFMVGYSEKGIVATEIWNEALAKTQSVIFEMVWESVRKS